MAKRVKTEQGIIMRYNAFMRLARMRNFYSEMPPIEIYGLDVKEKGAITFETLKKYL